MGGITMEIKFVRVDFKNNPVNTAESESHRRIIEEESKAGYSYSGYFPAKLGPSGKILSADLIFQK